LYSNDIPPLQIIGVAVSEDLNNAWTLMGTRGTEKNNLQFQYPVLVDASASPSAESGQVTDAWDLRTGGSFTYPGNVAGLYRLEKYGPVTCVLLDRSRRIRAVALSSAVIGNASENRFAELVECLLLNVGGVEAVPYDVTTTGDQELAAAIDPENRNSLYSWEYAAEIQRREAAAGGQTVVYPLLGQEAPEFELPLANGTGSATLSSLCKDKVTLLVFFYAGGSQADPAKLSFTDAAMGYLKVIDKMQIDWTLKLAQPGAQAYANATPFANTSIDIARASAKGGQKTAETPATTPSAASATGEQKAVSAKGWGEEEGSADIRERLNLALAFGARYYSWEYFADGKDLQDFYRANPIVGLKLKLWLISAFYAEASFLPSAIFGNFKEDAEHYNAKLQLMLPLAINVIIQPKLGSGKVSPFVSIGAGGAYANFKRRVVAYPLPAYPQETNTMAHDTLYPGGFGGFATPGVGVEFRLSEKLFAGIEIRKMYMTAQVSDKKEEEFENSGTIFSDRVYYDKDFVYENSVWLGYIGMKF
jgi:hypothetical protein